MPLPKSIFVHRTVKASTRDVRRRAGGRTGIAWNWSARQRRRRLSPEFSNGWGRAGSCAAFDCDALKGAAKKTLVIKFMALFSFDQWLQSCRLDHNLMNQIGVPVLLRFDYPCAIFGALLQAR